MTDDKYLKDLEKLRKKRQINAQTDTSDPFDVRIDKKNDAHYTYMENPSVESNKKNMKRKKKKHPIRTFILLILLLIVGYVVKAMYFTTTNQKGYYTFAVFGVDSRDGGLDKNTLSDVNMIVSLNRETGDIKIVSVYRDTYVQIDEEGTYHKFNEAHFKGGNKQAVECIQRNLDINPDNYVTFNWKSVADAINLVGGVDLEITEPEFKYINAFITETVESTGIASFHLEHAGANHLDGVQAVAYCRLRLMDSDYNRTQRQRKVVSLFLDKIKACNNATRIQIVQTILPEISTDIGLDDLIALAKDVGRMNITETAGFPFEKDTTYIGKKDCVIPITLKSNVVALHTFLFNDENYTPSDDVIRISKQIVSDSGLGSDDSEVTIKIDDKSQNTIGATTTQPNTEAEGSTETSLETPTETSSAEQAIEETKVDVVESSESIEDETVEIGPGVNLNQTKESTTGPSVEDEIFTNKTRKDEPTTETSPQENPNNFFDETEAKVPTLQETDTDGPGME